MTKSRAYSVTVQRQLKLLGEQLREARLRRNLTASFVAERAGVNVKTVLAAEKGDPGVTLGSLASVLRSLGLLDHIAKVADPLSDDVGQKYAADAERKRASGPDKT